jgi:hypothetical protein
MDLIGPEFQIEPAIMHEKLSLAEIEAQFKSEWILVEDPEVDDAQKVVGGKVLFHSPDRDTMYRKAMELKPREFAFLYTGTIPEGTAVVL